MPELDLSLWQTRLQEMMGLQAKQHSRWREAQAMVEGRWMRDLTASFDPDWTPVNYAKAYLTAVVASIYARNPYFFVKPRHGNYLQFASSMERVLNYLREELALKQTIKRCIVDALITGIAWVETGYTATFGTLEPEPQNEGGLFQRLLNPFKRPSEQGVLNEYVKEVSAYTLRVSAWKVFLAPFYHDVHEMPYLAIGEDIAPEDIQRHPLYSQSFSASGAQRSVQVSKDRPSVSLPGMQWGFGQPGLGGNASRLSRIWHLWDRREMQRFLWLDGTQEVAGPFKWTPSFEGFAQTPLIFNDLPESDRSANSYPIGDITFMIPQLRELSLLRTMQVKRRKRSGGQIIAQSMALTDEQARQIQQNDDLNLIRIKGNPSTDITTFTPGQMSPDVWKTGDRILADLDLIGQLGFLLPTLTAGDERSATEARFRAAGAGTVRSEKVDVIEEFTKTVGRKVAAVVWEFYPRSKVQEILGEEQLPEELWPDISQFSPDRRREIIERELEFSIEVGSTQPIQDKTLKNEQKIRLLNIIGGIAPERIKITSEGLGKLADDFEMPELREWMILDDEAEAKAIQQENQLLTQGIPQVVGPNDNHQLHEQGHAQVVLGGQATPAAEQHLLQHRQFRQMKGLAKHSQRGDEGATRGAAVRPEAMRQGMTNLSDLMTAIGKPLAERGNERGGMSNAGG